MYYSDLFIEECIEKTKDKLEVLSKEAGEVIPGFNCCWVLAKFYISELKKEEDRNKGFITKFKDSKEFQNLLKQNGYEGIVAFAKSEGFEVMDKSSLVLSGDIGIHFGPDRSICTTIAHNKFWLGVDDTKGWAYGPKINRIERRRLFLFRPQQGV